MLKFLRWFSTGMMFIANLVVSILFLACSFASQMHPRDWWFTGFLGLFYPVLFVVLILFLLFWILLKSKKALLPLLVLVAGFSNFRLHVALQLGNSFDASKKAAGSIRFMDWNIRHFIPFDESDFKPDREAHESKIFEEIKKNNPDVICFQEFISMPAAGEKDPMQLLKAMGYRYHRFAGEDLFGTRQYSGIAIFSRLPIVGGDVLPYPPSEDGNAESTVYADVVSGNDTFRVYSVHLQSFGFGNREYRALDDVRSEGSSVMESKHVIRKMRNTFYWHGMQADFIARELEKSPYPALIMGDLNDVPGSYAYTVVRGKRKDAFLEKGSGIGSTFTSSSSFVLQMIPTLRIDNIFLPQEMEVEQFAIDGERLSDHSYLVADIRLK
ncbi:MAG: endonuclease/exonuclease/phosphatase family protein [Chitinophagia bacterium]